MSGPPPRRRRGSLILPAPTLYEVRDGIYDWRYIQTLANAVKAPGPATAKAKAHLAELTDAVDPNLDRYYFQRKRNFNHVGRYGLRDTVWPGRRYQMARWGLARHIAAVTGRALPTPRAAGAATGGKVILHAETFGPFWVDASQRRHLRGDATGLPRLQLETPATPAGANWVTVLAKLDAPSTTTWSVLIEDDTGRDIATETVGVLKRWKTRWVLRTDHLSEGRYRLILIPTAGPKQPDPPIGVEFDVVPAIR